MNLYYSTSKGLRECREARRQRQQHPHPEGQKRKQRKPSLVARLLHWHH